MIDLLRNNENILKNLYAYIYHFIPPSIAANFQKRPGMHPNRWESLDRFFKENTFKSGLEFGRATGYTAALFALLYPDASIDSIDTQYQSWHEEFFALLGVKDRVNIITGISWESVPKGRMYDYVLIDGDHSYKGAKRDWLSIQNHLLPGAKVLFDDLSHNNGCGTVFEEIKLPKQKICSSLGVVTI